MTSEPTKNMESLALQAKRLLAAQDVATYRTELEVLNRSMREQFDEADPTQAVEIMKALNRTLRQPGLPGLSAALQLAAAPLFDRVVTAEGQLLRVFVYSVCLLKAPLPADAPPLSLTLPLDRHRALEQALQPLALAAPGARAVVALPRLLSRTDLIQLGPQDLAHGMLARLQGFDATAGERWPAAPAPTEEARISQVLVPCALLFDSENGSKSDLTGQVLEVRPEVDAAVARLVSEHFAACGRECLSCGITPPASLAQVYLSGTAPGLSPWQLLFEEAVRLGVAKPVLTLAGPSLLTTETAAGHPLLEPHVITGPSMALARTLESMARRHGVAVAFSVGDRRADH